MIAEPFSVALGIVFAIFSLLSHARVGRRAKVALNIFVLAPRRVLALGFPTQLLEPQQRADGLMVVLERVALILLLAGILLLVDGFVDILPWTNKQELFARVGLPLSDSGATIMTMVVVLGGLFLLCYAALWAFYPDTRAPHILEPHARAHALDAWAPAAPKGDAVAETAIAPVRFGPRDASESDEEYRIRRQHMRATLQRAANAIPKDARARKASVEGSMRYWEGEDWNKGL